MKYAPYYIDIADEVEKYCAECLQQVHRQFEALLSWVKGDEKRTQLHCAEDSLWKRLMVLGCDLMLLWLAYRFPKRAISELVTSKGRYRYHRLTYDVIRTRFGTIYALRRTYLRYSGKGPRVISPDDRRIGLAAGRMSLRVHFLVGFFAARMCFDEALNVMSYCGDYVPGKRASLGIVDMLGPIAREFLDNLGPPDGDGEILIIQVDGKGAPMVRREEHQKRCKPHRKRPSGTSQRGVRRIKRRANPKKRRKKGDKSKNARMAMVAVVYTLRRLPDGSLEGPINKRTLSTFRGLKVLRPMLLREAIQRGYGSKLTVFLGDGAKCLWTLHEKSFPKAIPCLDWFHLCEYLWEAGGTCHNEGSKELEEWVRGRKEELRNDSIDAVFEALKALLLQIGARGPGTKGRRKRVKDAIKYIENHREQIRYKELVSQDIDVATGAVEGAVKHLIGVRLDGQGMRWSVERAEHVLALRLVVINGLWSMFEEYVSEQHSKIEDFAIPAVSPDRPRLLDWDEQSKAA